MKEKKRFLIKLLSGALALTATFALGSCDLSGGVDGLLDGILPDSEEHVHNWSEWEELAPATCEEDGEQRRECLNDGCDVILETKKIPSLGHQYENGFCETCNELNPNHESEGLRYELSSDKNSYIVTGIGTCIDSTIAIPSVYKNLPVTAIGDRAFYNCKSLTSLVIGDSVESIGKYAFYLCDNLTSVYITDIAAWCNIDFGNYEANPLYCADKLYLNDELVTELVNPDIKEIKDYAFYGCESLTSVKIGKSVTSIGEDAFNNCSSLTSVEIGKLVTSIGNGAFSNCPIETATMPTIAISYIPKSKLKKVVIISGDSIDSYAFSDCTNLTSVEIPDSVKSIGEKAFYNCPIETATIPTNAISFISQSKLKEVKITSGDSIGSYAFSNCTNLTSVTLPALVESIYEKAFYNCTSLTSVEIPDSVKSIGEKAFYNCTSLTSVYITDIAAWCNIDFGKGSANPLYYAKNLYLNNKSVTELVIPDTVTKIYKYAFYGCNSLKSVEIGDSVTKIGDYAFSYCKSLTSVVIGDSVKSIGDYAFSYCPIENATMPTIAISCIPKSKLKTVVTTSGDSISEKAFYNCSGLTSVVIGDSVKVESIGDYAFSGCTSLTNIKVDKNNTTCKDIDGNLYSKNGTKLIQYAIGKTATEFIMPDSVTTIGEDAFSYCNSLNSVVIPDSVTSIGDGAFYGCYKLVEVYNKSSLEISAGSTDNGCVGYYAKAVYTEPYESKLSTDENGYIIYTDGDLVSLIGYTGTQTDLVLPEGITEIYKYAFYGCKSLTRVVIGDSVTSIGSWAFYNCDSLTSVKIPDSVDSIGDYAFAYCTSLTSVVIGDSVTSIGESAFAYCKSLTSVEIGDSVTSIGDSAFYNCGSLTSVEIGDSVTSIGNYAFWCCDSLSSVVIPDSVTTIGDYAFSYCNSLTSVVIGNSVTSIGESAFDGCWRLASVYYKGTEEEWAEISVGSGNAYLTNAPRYCYTDSRQWGNYWHYDENGEIVVW